MPNGDLANQTTGTMSSSIVSFISQGISVGWFYSSQSDLPTGFSSGAIINYIKSKGGASVRVLAYEYQYRNEIYMKTISATSGSNYTNWEKIATDLNTGLAKVYSVQTGGSGTTSMFTMEEADVQYIGFLRIRGMDAFSLFCASYRGNTDYLRTLGGDSCTDYMAIESGHNIHLTSNYGNMIIYKVIW